MRELRIECDRFRLASRGVEVCAVHSAAELLELRPFEHREVSLGETAGNTLFLSASDRRFHLRIRVGPHGAACRGLFEIALSENEASELLDGFRSICAESP